VEVDSTPSSVMLNQQSSPFIPSSAAAVSAAAAAAAAAAMQQQQGFAAVAGLGGRGLLPHPGQHTVGLEVKN